MKKILIACLLIAVVCMAACGDENKDATTDLGAGANPDTNPVGGITTPDPEPAKDPHEGWTHLIGKVYIPDLPFEDWAGQNQDNISCFTVFIKSGDSAAFHTYAKSLTDFGYTIEQTESYSYSGTDPDGRKISLTDHENGQMQISVYY